MNFNTFSRAVLHIDYFLGTVFYNVLNIVLAKICIIVFAGVYVHACLLVFTGRF